MICSVCGKSKTKNDFSSSQLKKKKEERKCKICSSTKDTSVEKYNILVSWLQQNGSTFPNLEIKHYSNTFRGVIASTNIQKNKCIMSIPRKCIITTILAQKSAICKELLQNKKVDDVFSNHTWIALYLIQERNNPESFWKPYLDILPTHFMSFPHYFDSSTLSTLSNSFVIDMITARKSNLEKEYNLLYNYIPSFQDTITLEMYIWARIVVITRVFHIQLGKTISTQGLVPMADMLNHTLEPTTHWKFEPEKDSFIIMSTSFQKKGIEVYDTYGPKCNSRYLVNYGFTQENNIHTQAVLFLHPENILSEYNCSYREQKMKLLQGNHTNIDDSYTNYSYLIHNRLEKKVSVDKCFRFQFVRTLIPRKVSIQDEKCTSTHSTYCLLGFLRYLLCSEKEFAYIVETINKSKQTNLLKILLCIQPLSIETEYKVLQVLSDYCKKELLQYPTTLEEDKEKHKDLQKYTKEWNISNILQGEKQVLLFYIDLFSSIENIDYREPYRISKILRNHPEYKVYYSLFIEKLI